MSGICGDKVIEEDILFCQHLQLHTTGEAIFNVLDMFVHENGLAWDQCVGLQTNGGVQAVTGCELCLLSTSSSTCEMDTLHGPLQSTSY